MRGRLRRGFTVAAVLLAAAAATWAQQVVAPTQEELAAITERGRLLNEYDQAAWHASDAVQMANPKNVEGQRYIAKKENGKWYVVFGKLNEDRSKFAVRYEGVQQANSREFAVHEEPAERLDEGFFLFAARAIELAMKDFGRADRPYNVAVLPGPKDQLYVYVYPAQTNARIYLLGGDVRYLVSPDGNAIVEKRQMHKSIVETPPVPKGKKDAFGVHTHVLSDLPEDTDVYHVLTQDPPKPEFVGTAHFMYKVQEDGTIVLMKEMKKRK